MTTFYKATRPDGTDFRTGNVDYAGALDFGEVVRHPSSSRMIPDQPATYLSVSVEPAETLIGGRWPCRLFRVEPDGNVLDGLVTSPHKRACLALRVVEELPAWQALGPNGEAVAALLRRAAERTSSQEGALWDAWHVARGVAREAAYYAAREAAYCAARGAAWGVTYDAAGGGGAVRDAARALIVRDLITEGQYTALTGVWVSVMGSVLS